MSDSQELAATGTVEELSVQIERLREELQRRDRELEELRTVASRATRKLELVRKPLEDRVVHLERDLEQTEMKGELTMLRALESLRAEHRGRRRSEQSCGSKRSRKAMLPRGRRCWREWKRSVNMRLLHVSIA